MPLIGPSSELSYRLEPHDIFTGSDVAGVDVLGVLGRGGCTRGGLAGWVPGEYYTGYYPEAGFMAYFRNIKD